MGGRNELQERTRRNRRAYAILTKLADGVRLHEGAGGELSRAGGLEASAGRLAEGLDVHEAGTAGLAHGEARELGHGGLAVSTGRVELALVVARLRGEDRGGERSRYTRGSIGSAYDVGKVFLGVSPGEVVNHQAHIAEVQLARNEDEERRREMKTWKPAREPVSRLVMEREPPGKRQKPDWMTLH